MAHFALLWLCTHTRPPTATCVSLILCQDVDQMECQDIAQFLVRENFLLTALEFHEELQERNGGVHQVDVLNNFFTDPARLEAVLEESAQRQERDLPGSIPSSVPSPFVNNGYLSTIDERDDKIALLSYKLRVAEEDLVNMKESGGGAE